MGTYKLYGDGIHDDYSAIQELLDSGISEVVLPRPHALYSIGKTLKIHSGQKLTLLRDCVIRLADGASCSMLENSDFSALSSNITVEGGIWDMNNAAQDPNPWHFPGKDGLTARQRLSNAGLTFADLTEPPNFYTGMCMRFCGIRHLTLKNLTIRNPVTYGVQIYKTEDFHVGNIEFDYTVGAPKLWNMDGIHVEGYCKNGRIENLRGACHDDTVAITTDDMLYGPVSDITVDGISAVGAHSAVRLLSHGIPLEDVSISNVEGSYYTYCISLTKYYGGDSIGIMRNVKIKNVNASASLGTKDVGGGNFPFIWVEGGLDVNDLTIENVHRRESAYPTSTVRIDKEVHIGKLTVKNVATENLLNKPIENLEILGSIDQYFTD